MGFFLDVLAIEKNIRNAKSAKITQKTQKTQKNTVGSCVTAFGSIIHFCFCLSLFRVMDVGIPQHANKSTPSQQSRISPRSGRVHRNRLLATETIQIMRAASLGSVSERPYAESNGTFSNRSYNMGKCA